MFVASDVVDKETSEDGSTQRIERRCALDVDAPRLLKRVCFGTVCVCVYVFVSVFKVRTHLVQKDKMKQKSMDDRPRHCCSGCCMTRVIFCVCVQIAGVDYVYFIQKNTLNRKERTLHIESHNETFSNRVIIHETCCYSVSGVLSSFQASSTPLRVEETLSLWFKNPPKNSVPTRGILN